MSIIIDRNLNWSDIKQYYKKQIRFMEPYIFPDGLSNEAEISMINKEKFIEKISDLDFTYDIEEDTMSIPRGYTATLVESYDSDGWNPGITFEKNNEEFSIELDPDIPIIEILVEE